MCDCDAVTKGALRQLDKEVDLTLLETGRTD